MLPKSSVRHTATSLTHPPNTALAAAERAHLPPDSKEVVGMVVELGQLYEDLGQWQDAATTFNDAWRRYVAGQHYPQAVGAAQRTGRSFEATGDLQHAETAYAVRKGIRAPYHCYSSLLEKAKHE